MTIKNAGKVSRVINNFKTKIEEGKEVGEGEDNDRCE